MNRRASVLIIVVGLAMLILSLSLSYVMVVRSDLGEVQALSRDVQARAMLNAALCYIAEGSRIGWSTVGRQGVNDLPNRYASETLGWNDLRNGVPGPVPLRVWTAGGAEEAPQAQVDAGGDSLHRVGRGTGRWPDLGSTVRQSLYVWERPPQAVALEGNPIRIHPTSADLPPEGGWYFTGNREVHGVNVPFAPAGQQVAAYGHVIHRWDGGNNYSGRIFRFARQPRPDPAPLAASLAAFNAGNPMPRRGSTRSAWFRVYRELASDHDGDGVPWFDTVNLHGDASTPPNASVFIIACGAGGTQGFRDWDEVLTELGVATAAEVFHDEATFWDIRRDEAILWFRAEWTAYTQQNLAPNGALSTYRGPGHNPGDQFGQRGPINRQEFVLPPSTGSALQFQQRRISPVTWPAPLPFGSFRWVASLEREPPTW